MVKQATANEAGLTMVESRISSRAILIGTLTKVTMVSAACLVLANCATSPGNFARLRDSKYGVFASPRLVDSSGPIDPSLTRHGVAMVGRPYMVAGKRYVPHIDPHYSVVGVASWYGSDFHGRMTANGELFDMHGLTAAHPTMPLPSYARVTNLNNGDSIVVRVNDRGPYHGGRVIDVSSRAADLLGFKSSGIGRVKVDYLGRAEPSAQDTSMLMATLRTDGTVAPLPSSLGGPANVMVADASPVPPGEVPAGAEDTDASTPALAYQAAPAPKPIIAPTAPAFASVAPVATPTEAAQPTADIASDQTSPAVSQPALLAVQTASFNAGVIPLQSAGMLDLDTIPNAATPVAAKIRPGFIPLPPQRSADAGRAVKPHFVETAPMKLHVADIVGTVATLGDTPMMATALAYTSDADPLPGMAATAPADEIFVDAGVFHDAASAEQLRWLLAQTGTVVISTDGSVGATIWHVRAGPYADHGDAEAAAAMARNAGAASATLSN